MGHAFHHLQDSIASPKKPNVHLGEDLRCNIPSAFHLNVWKKGNFIFFQLDCSRTMEVSPLQHLLEGGLNARTQPTSGIRLSFVLLIGCLP